MLVNSKKILESAKEGNYAVPQFNVTNLEWAKYILEKCEEMKRPVILGFSEGAIKYMGGPNTVVNLIKGLMQDLNTTIDTVIHLDHGTTVETAKKVIDAGFTSVMIDASKYELEENIRMTKEVVDYAHKFNVTVEAEVGHVGGVEDNISATNLNATLEECIEMVTKTGIDSLAPAVGTSHGPYKGEPKIDFDLIKIVTENIEVPLVLHGGSGVPEASINSSINSGINKVNIDTELKQAWHKEMLEFVKENSEAYDPRKVIGSGEKAIKEVIEYKMNLFSNR